MVDISSNLQYLGGTAEATGMVISSNGLVLTNNHVIDQTTGLTATLVSDGQRFTAKWLGYDKTDDVSVIQLQGASGLKTVPLGDSSAVKVGDRGGRDRQRRGRRRQADGGHRLHHPAEPDHHRQR